MLERLRGGHSVISVQFVIEGRFHTSFNKALRRGFTSVDVLTALRIVEKKLFASFCPSLLGTCCVQQVSLLFS